MMTKPALVGALALVMLTPSVVLAKTDCHLDMKDMLQGTLEISKQTDAREADDDKSDGCTLADWQERLSPLEAWSMAPSDISFFARAA